jgi:hypothetical protein
MQYVKAEIHYSFVLLESPFAPVATVRRGHLSLVSLRERSYIIYFCIVKQMVRVREKQGCRIIERTNFGLPCMADTGG